MDVPAFKVASFELVDLPLIRRMAATGKPLIMSTGMATEAEIDEAVAAARAGWGDRDRPAQVHQRLPVAARGRATCGAIDAMATRWGVPVGLSDHTHRDDGARSPPSRWARASSRST